MKLFKVPTFFSNLFLSIFKCNFCHLGKSKLLFSFSGFSILFKYCILILTEFISIFTISKKE